MPGQLIKRSDKVWLCRVYLGRDPQTGKRLYQNRTVHGLRRDAERVLAELLRDRDFGMAGLAAESTTVGTLLDLVLTDYRVNGKSEWWAKGYIEKHLRPFFGNAVVSRVSSSMIAAFIDKLREAGLTNGTINRNLSLLRRAFNLGRMANPPMVTRAPRIPALAENNVRKGFFEHGEYIALLAELPPHLRPLLTFAYYTGCRKGELLALEWPQVDLLEGVVRLEGDQTKNGEARMIPLCPEVVESLKLHKSDTEARYPECSRVFHYNGAPFRDFRDAWERACKDAGLWIGDAKTGKPSRLFHDLRRTGVRNLVRSGVPEGVAMRVSGHKTRAVFERYNVVSEADLKLAAARLSEHLKAKNAALEGNRHTIGTQAPEGANGTIARIIPN